jgi:hypothetical protein
MGLLARTAQFAAALVSATTAFAADLPTKKTPPAPIPQPILPSTWRDGHRRSPHPYRGAEPRSVHLRRWARVRHVRFSGPCRSGDGLQGVVAQGIGRSHRGFTANYRFDPKWFVKIEGDLGGWSDSATGQALGAVGYNWTPSIASILGYRVLYIYDKQDSGGNGSFRLQQWMYGQYAAIKYGFEARGSWSADEPRRGA